MNGSEFNYSPSLYFYTTRFYDVYFEIKLTFSAISVI